MRTRIYFSILVLASLTNSLASNGDHNAPLCALRCWENSKYISLCVNDDSSCLCIEPTYQNTVFQCIYAQCDTAHFGPAVHYTITQCTDFNVDLISAPPSIVSSAELRRRELEYIAGGNKLVGSGSAFNYPTQSNEYLTRPISFVTQSAGNQYDPVANLATATSFTSLPSEVPLITGYASSAIQASATKIGVSPQSLFTGLGPRSVPFNYVTTGITFAGALYLVL